MRFITFISKVMLATTEERDIINETEDYALYWDNETVSLAIYLPHSNNCALYSWDNFNNVGKDNVQAIVMDKVKEVVAIYQNTIGLMSSICPNTIHKECEDIFTYNKSQLKYQNNGVTETLLSHTIISLEQDFIQSVWFVQIGDKKYSLNNENAARHLYRLIKKDIDNYIGMRWNKL
jgi:hypothetical protein